MTMMPLPLAFIAPLANAVPENTGDGYVAAAYIVFFVLVLVYVAIMAVRLTRVERDLRRLRLPAHESPPEESPSQTGPSRARESAPGADSPRTSPPHARESVPEGNPAAHDAPASAARERETV
jgi:hypothetical protein